MRPLPEEGRLLPETPRVEVGEHVEPAPPAAATDPVCGMEVDPATAAASEELQGRTYHFCSAACHQKFVADPERFGGYTAGAAHEHEG